MRHHYFPEQVLVGVQWSENKKKILVIWNRTVSVHSLDGTKSSLNGMEIRKKGPVVQNRTWDYRVNSINPNVLKSTGSRILGAAHA
jgi:hypothetical protein